MSSVMRFDEWQDSNGNAVINGVNGFAGAVMAFARDTAPDGWIKANGANISRTTYSKLFDAIGTSFGVGDGSTTFTLPDMRGEFPRGWDDARGVDSGRAFGSAQLDQMQKITGLATNVWSPGVSSGAITYTAGANARPSSGSNGSNNFNFDSANSPDARVSATTAGETRARNVALLFCIKF